MQQLAPHIYLNVLKYDTVISEDILAQYFWEWVLYFFCVGPGNQTQVIEFHK